MKMTTLNLLRLYLALAFLPFSSVADTLTVVHSFASAGGVNVPNADGGMSAGGVILASNVLYGTTYVGGSGGNGTVYKVNRDGTGFTTLHAFSATSGANSINTDGAQPQYSLVLSNNTLYGVTSGGGLFGSGTIFKVNTDGSGFAVLHSFTDDQGGFTANADGAYPAGSLLLLGNALFGTAYTGGTNGSGVVFKINADGSGFTNLHSFDAVNLDDTATYTNTDGGFPSGGLTVVSNVLYGTAQFAGQGGSGTVFKLNPDGSGFAVLHTFPPTTGAANVNSEGGYPFDALTAGGSNLYGQNEYGGTYGNGTLFHLNLDGTGYTVLHTFTALITNFVHTSTSTNALLVNGDGINPSSRLVLAGNTLYGSANSGGYEGVGDVFAVNTDGTGFTNLYNFSPIFAIDRSNSEGASLTSWGGLFLADNTLYGVTDDGGTGGAGTVFSFDGVGVSAPQSAGMYLYSNENPAGYHDANWFGINLAPNATGNVIFRVNDVPFSTNTIANGSVSSVSIAMLLRGTNIITAVYAGDSNYLSSTNELDQIVTNHPPVASDMTLTRGKGQTIKVALSDLATNWTDVDGAPVTLTGISQTSTNGRTLYALNFTANSDGSYAITNTAFIGYLNPSNVTDRFSYSIRDDNGNTNIGYVNVVVSSSPMFGQATGIFSAPSQPVLLNFLGHPGYSYNVQRSTNLVTWSTIWTTNAPPAGPFSYTDSFADLGGHAPSSAYYRLSWNP